MSLVIPNNATDFKTNLGLGTAADVNVGTSAGNAIQLGAGGALPAVDGSNLTGLGTGASLTPYGIGTRTTSYTATSLTTYNIYDLVSVTESSSGAIFDSGTSTIKPTTAGYYHISGNVYVTTGSGHLFSWFADLSKNGTGIFSGEQNHYNNYGHYDADGFGWVEYFNGSTDYGNVQLTARSDDASVLYFGKISLSVICIKPD